MLPVSGQLESQDTEGGWRNPGMCLHDPRPATDTGIVSHRSVRVERRMAGRVSKEELDGTGLILLIRAGTLPRQNSQRRRPDGLWIIRGYRHAAVSELVTGHAPPGGFNDAPGFLVFEQSQDGPGRGIHSILPAGPARESSLRQAAGQKLLEMCGELHLL